jgi:TonB family protein
MKRNALPLIAAIGLLITAQVFLATARAAPQEKPEPPKIIRKGGDLLQGSATKRVEPAYPPLAKTARVTGAVVVEVTVDEEGKVIAARAISGHPLLKDAAVNAARAWIFTPTTLSGTPVKVIGTLTFNFTLDYSKDIDKLKQEIVEHPGDSELYISLGGLYVDNQQIEEAMGAYKQALALKPDSADAQFAIGRLLRKQGRSEEASQIYQQMISANLLSSLEADECTVIGRTLYESRHYREAVEALNQAIEKDSDDEDNYMLLGLAYLKLGDKQAAMKQYDILKDKEPALAKQLLELIKKQ